ncbi:MAG: tetratricopeptide repeat protein [Acidobacteriota bacterium]|nr:MAG: tetratricopeptide repeat protein [Acidobacteriota bacterium]
MLGDDHPDTLISILNMGGLLRDQEEFERARALLAPAVEAVRRALPRKHPVTGGSMFQHGVCLSALGRHAEAELELLEAHELLTSVISTRPGARWTRRRRGARRSRIKPRNCRSCGRGTRTTSLGTERERRRGRR